MLDPAADKLDPYERIRALEVTVQKLQEENRLLRLEITRVSRQTQPTVTSEPVNAASETDATVHVSLTGVSAVLPSGLTKDHIERYSRQLLLTDGFGVPGQATLQRSSVLVVGAGGIGSTVLLYLAAAGVGTIGIVDHDTVDVSNLHRQVIHGMETVGWNKAHSACRSLTNLNPTITYHAITEALTATNALTLVSAYNVVVDASDNPATRYLINDACVYAHKPLISGSAVGTQGQLTVYNDQRHATPSSCYRCLYPKPAVQASCQSCSDAGVLGPVPGLIGILQAMETLKVLTHWGSSMHDRLLLYDGAACSFLNVKKPPRRLDCSVCGNHPTLCTMKDSHATVAHTRGPQDSTSCLLPLVNATDVSCRDYERVVRSHQAHVLLDVRVESQFAMCALPEAVNIPLALLPDALDRLATLTHDGQKAVYCLCRRGVASEQATRLLTERLPRYTVYNIRGGLVAWQAQVDSTFPKY